MVTEVVLVVAVVSEGVSGVGSLAGAAEEDTPDLEVSAAVNMEEGWAGGEVACERLGPSVWNFDDSALINEIVR